MNSFLILVDNLSLGWDAHSYAYHADDGHIFDQCGQGKDYGPSFSTGDTIGCCINYANKTAFFTKNGVFLGVAFKNINLSESFYPCVGLRTPGEKVYVNFGQEPFVFDIAHYVKVNPIESDGLVLIFFGLLGNET